MKKSNSIALFPILHALNALSEKRATIANYESTPEHDFLFGLLERSENLPLDENQIKALVSQDLEELNAFLRKHGFDIQLQGPIDLGVVTIMDLVGKWLEKATETTINHEGIIYPAVFMKTGVSMVYSNNTQVIRIRTKSEFDVYIEPNAIERSGLELFKHILDQSNDLLSPEQDCDIMMPMITLDQKPDISWVCGIEIETTTGRTKISEALQQNKLTLNCDGIHAESAVVLGTRKSISLDTKSFIIDQPFNIWIGIENDQNIKPFPLFTAYIAPDTWKKS